MTVALHLGDCLDVLRTLPDASVDAVVTDPPAGIGFMGKEWDHHKGGRAQWVAWLADVLAECLRVAKPGAVMLCWAIPRTSHWTATAIEDAGWQIEDRIAHLFGTGFPKHHSKLKPACEDWWLARKPGPKWLGVDAGRIATTDSLGGGATLDRQSPKPEGWDRPWRHDADAQAAHARRIRENVAKAEVLGRWPANVVLDEEAAAMLDEQAGERASNSRRIERTADVGYHGNGSGLGPREFYGDTGGASRFFYVAKASRADRNEGLEGMPERRSGMMEDDAYKWQYDGNGCKRRDEKTKAANHHPTVKSTALMRWLCRIACPPGGVILDPFMGSGSTGKAAVAEGMAFVGIEREPEYHAIAERRIEAEQAKRPLLEPTA